MTRRDRRHRPSSRRLRAGRFVLTAEVVPPISCDADDLLNKALPLQGLADAVNVTDGAGARAHMGAVAAAAILAQHGIEPILQLACRDRNRIGLQSDLMGASALGIRNLLLLRGDEPTPGDQPDAKPVFDLDSRALSRRRGGSDDGELPTGTKVAGATRASSSAPPMRRSIRRPTGSRPRSRARSHAGAQFAQTQFCMDAGVRAPLRGAAHRRRHHAGSSRC